MVYIIHKVVQEKCGGVGDSTKKVWNNPYGYNSGNTIKTGYAGNSADAKTEYKSLTAPSNVIEYNKKNTSGLDGTKASTTGTVYGVYDMAGGSCEFVAGVLKGESSDLEIAERQFDISNQTRPNEVTGVNFAKKYLDLYNYRILDNDYSQYIIGDATIETKGWNSDKSKFISLNCSVFMRGREL